MEFLVKVVDSSKRDFSCIEIMLNSKTSKQNVYLNIGDEKTVALTRPLQWGSAFWISAGGIVKFLPLTSHQLTSHLGHQLTIKFGVPNRNEILTRLAYSRHIILIYLKSSSCYSSLYFVCLPIKEGLFRVLLFLHRGAALGMASSAARVGSALSPFTAFLVSNLLI